jgi:hypothetical protein
MHTQYPKIEEDNEIPKVLSAKQNLEIWSTTQFDSVATILPGLKPRQYVLSSGLQTLLYHLGDMHNPASKICKDITLQT